MTHHQASSLTARLLVVVEELRATPGVELLCATVRPSARGEQEPMANHRELARSEGLLLDDAMCATWDAVDVVEIRWRTADEQYGDLLIPDWFDLEEAYVIPSDHGATGAEADFLTELHLLECDDASHWTAFRTPGLAQEAIRAERMEIWTRVPSARGRGDVDLQLHTDWGGYVERMLLARGAWRWQLTLVPDAAIPREERRAVATEMERFVAASALFSDPALEVLRAETTARLRRLKSRRAG